MEAVPHMDGLNNSLRHSWVHYAPITPSRSEFFGELRRDIWVDLATTFTLEFMAGHKRRPRDLIMVSENLRDDDGRPLMMDTNNEDECLAEKYHDPENEEYLLKLGVRVTSDRVFRNQLISPLQSRPRPFLEKKSNAWHASLARIICEMYRSSTEYRYSPISDLPIIPLRGGEWVSPRWCGRKSYLSSSSGLAIPEGITMLMVDNKAAADPDRWKLYQLLGIPVLTKDRIKEAIVNTHDD
ncbi:hypothetical protein NW767_014168 [Fusarium falciforme]|nr:hypothetical protein NW767_014168 [Fusarium falciforme]